MDQADKLRKLARQAKDEGGTSKESGRQKKTRGFAVASGKGGVGKTNIVANVAFTLAKRGKKVLIFDADIGLGNIHILLGLLPQYTLDHILNGERSIEDVLIAGPAGIDILPASTGGKIYSEFSKEEKLLLRGELEVLEGKYDYIIFDVGAGISSNVIYFCNVVNEVMVVCTSEPPAFADAYAFMKVLSRDYGKINFGLIVNMVDSEKDGLGIFKKLTNVADKFMPEITIDYLGYLLKDENLPTSVNRQRILVEHHPKSVASRCIKNITDDIISADKENNFSWDRLFE